MTTNDGTRKKVTKKPWKRPTPRPTSSAARIAAQPGQSFLTLSTAITEAARPLTMPTDRSISPSSSTRTTPVAMIPSPAIWSIRLVRLPAVRKFSSETEK